MSEAVDLRLKTRWLEKQPDGKTLRDAMLERIRRECSSGAERPPALDLRGIDLSRQDLRGLNLSGYDLSGANLSSANLERANLSFAGLEGAQLAKANLNQAELMGARLVRAKLDECRADSAGFGAADLTEAHMVGGHFANATFSKACLSGVDARAASFRNARLVECDLSSGKFTRADMRGCDLKNANAEGASFDLADMREARLMGLRNFRKARWVGSDIRGIDLRGAYLIRRHIEDENYLFEFRTRDWLHAVIYWLWWLTSDCGRSMGRWTLVLAVVVFLFGWLYRLAGVDFGQADGPFASFYFSIVTMTTLGYGDIHPQSTAGQVLASAEALLGYVGLGGLLSILANKMARRAE